MNKVEAWKSEKHGFDVWGDVQAYARDGTKMADIAEADLERMKWYGIFYRKRVEDGLYMIRVRIPGCELTSAQARVIAKIAQVGYSIVDVTTRGNVQVQGLHIQHLPGVLADLEASGLTAKQTGHDNVRNVMTHPWSGLDPEELVDVRDLCVKLTDVFMDNRELSNLPRKFNVAAEGREIPALHCWTQDTTFVAGRKPDGSISFRWLVAGTQGQNPRLAWTMPVWVDESQAPGALSAALHVFNDEGSREKRDKARLRYLIEKIGPESFLEKVEARLGYQFDRAEGPIPESHHNEDFIGWFAQKQPGKWALGVNVTLGRLTHEQLSGLADLAETFGDGTLRTAYDQGIVVPNIAAGRKVAAARALNGLGLDHEADSVTRNIIACTGRQFCNIAVSETKGHAFGLIDRLKARGVGLAGIKVNMSGCPSSCAMTYTGDIGLKGVRVRRKGGTRDGFDVFLGGGAHGPVELALPYCKGVDVDQLPEMIAKLVRTYDDEHEGDVTFSQYWRNRIAADHASTAVHEDDHRVEIWVCDGCAYKHHGEDPPVFCPKCAALRRSFARLDDETRVEAEAVALAAAVEPPKPSGRADGYRDVADAAALDRDGRLSAQVDNRELAIFLVDGQVRCMDGLCPHEGGPMSQGELKNGVVTCPWHGWDFRTADGSSADGYPCSLRVYPAKLEDGRVLVSLADASAPAPTFAAPTQADEVSLPVLAVIHETADTKTIRLDNSAGLIAAHKPGQHLKLGLTTGAGLAWRSFTISSSPSGSTWIDLTIKLNPGGTVSSAAHALKPGDSVQVKGPAGKFYFDCDTHREPLVLAVAGSGVTPAMAILRELAGRQLDNPVLLLYGSRTPDDIIFAREIDTLRLRLPSLRVVLTLSQPGPDWIGASGRVTPDLISRHVANPSSARYFLCGPGAMRDALVDWLKSVGVPSDRVHWEQFGKSAPRPASATV